MPIGHAQGLLYAFDALYVPVDGTIKGPDGKANGSGLYRLTTPTATTSTTSSRPSPRSTAPASTAHTPSACAYLTTKPPQANERTSTPFSHLLIHGSAASDDSGP